MLTLMIAGRLLEGWTAVSVSRAVDSAASSFDIELTEKWSPKKTEGGSSEPFAGQIRPGAPCRVLLDGELVITGYVDTYSPSYDATTHSVRVAGRSRTGDVVDCSAVVPGGQFSGYDVAQIAERLCGEVGVGVVVESGPGAPFPDVQVQQGESIFELIERLCRLRALLVCDNEAGNLVLTRAGIRSSGGTIRQGDNILTASADLSVGERFSDYIVKGQQASSDDVNGFEATETVARIRDPGVDRYRPKLIVAEGQADVATARDRANWEKLTRGANGVRATINVQGWRDAVSGRLWRANEMVTVDSPWLGLTRDLLIAAVNYRLDEGGTVAELTLAPPEAFTPEPASPDSASGGGGLWSILDGEGALTPPVGRVEGNDLDLTAPVRAGPR